MKVTLGTPFLVAVLLFGGLWVISFAIERRLEARFRGLFRFLRNGILPTIAGLWALEGVFGYQRADKLFQVVETLLGFSLVWFLANLLKVLFFADTAKDSVRARTPRLLVDIVRLCFVVVGCLLVYSSVWNKDISPLLTTFGVGSLVLGLALQDTLGNLFAGLSLVFERPVAVGDWIQVGDLVGKVRQINWRSVRIVTRELNEITIPNSAIGKDRITNFSNPSRTFGFKMNFNFPFDVPPTLVKDMLREVALGVPGVLSSPAPDPRTIEFGSYAVQYELRLFIDDYENFVAIRNEFMTRVWYAMKRQGVMIPYPTTNLYKTELPYQPEPKEHERLVVGLLRGAQIFSALSDEEISTLEREVVFERFGRGERILAEGAVGEFFYLLVSGECTVIIKGEAGQELPLSTIRAGGVFGEMSLLSGKPRSASVDAASDVEVARVSKSALSSVMNKRPELLQTFAHYVAQRVQEAEEIRTRNAREVAPEAQDIDERALRERIKRFFGLS